MHLKHLKGSFAWVGILLMVSAPVIAHPGPDASEISLGSNPLRSFGGSVTGGSSQPVYTVPDGQEFIVTMVATSTAGVSAARDVIHGFDFLENAEVVLSGYVLSSLRQGSIARGNGRLRIRAGSTLYARLQGPGTGDFYLQGFLVAAGSPYRSLNGTTETLNTTVMTAEPDLDFVVRTVLTDCPSTGGAASVLVDGAVVVPDSTDLTILSHWHLRQSPFVTGEGQLVVPAGKTLGLRATPPCDYYIDGEYVTP